ncbi:MAG: LamG-like jellyroll fold domain-containing protein [Alphaproteobacteria bacterium]|nr:LamG-like jellyroll fold domain-containing protein [Alphaproteobacteria bacterium]
MAEMDLVELQELVLNGGGNKPLPDHLIEAAEVINVQEDGMIQDGRLRIVFDPETAQLIAVFEDDLAIITEDGEFIVLKDFVPAVSEGMLELVALPDGSLQEAPDFLEEYGLGSGLAEALADIETAAGETAIPSSTTNRAEANRFENEALNSDSEDSQNAPLGSLGGGGGGGGQSQSGNSQAGGDNASGGGSDSESASGGASGGNGSSGGSASADTGASAPDLAVSNAITGSEDQSVALTIEAALTDLDGSETLAITISGLPEGAQLSAGVHDPVSEAWVLTESDLAGLMLTPPTNFDGSIDLTVRAIAVESNGGARTVVSDTVSVQIDPEADLPTLTLSTPASGLEDTEIDLDIQAVLSDESETLSITISGIPEGATLSAGTVNEDGSVTLTPAQLEGLTITPAANSADDFTLTVTATSTDGTDTATQTAELPVTVTGVADEATLGTAAASGDEDSAIALDIDVSGVNAGDSASVTISGIPEGATLSAGTVNEDGSVTLTPAQLEGLTITPAADSDADFTLTVAVTTTDADSGDTATVTETLDVTVDAVADTPSLAVDAAAGSEDSAIALDITSALTDTDGSETLAVTISGIPEGATLSAGTVNEDGSVTLTPAQLEGLTITPAANSADDFTLTVTATSTDGTDTATQTASLPVSVTGVADEATLGTASASGDEDSAIALDIDVSGVNAGDSASVTISGIPEGATLSAGTVNEDGSVTLTPAQLEGLTITPAADSDADFTLTVAVTTTDADSGDTATVTETLDVTVDAVADTPSLAVDAAAGSEDSAIALDITSALTDTDGSETLAVTISGIPEGATLSAGTVNEDGSVTLTPAQLEGLTITPAANSADDFTLTVTATSTDGTDTATQTAELPVTVTGVADEATLGTAADSGDEDSAIALDINVSNVADGDSASVTISGIPDGATLSAGTVNEDGTVTLTPAQLEGLTITPAADSDADFTLTVAVTTTDADSGDTATVTETLDVTVDAVADTPSLAVDAAAGSEDSAIALDITSALTDTDGSETLAVTISGIPEGATLSAGTVNEDGSVTLTPAQLEGLTITPAANSADDFTLTVTATSTDGTDTATQTAELPVTVTGIADEATLGTAAASGDEDSAIALDIDVSNVADGDSASVTISGIPGGATLSAGTVNEDGSVTLTPAQLEGLTITPAADSDADFTLTVAVTTTDGDSGDTATVTETLDVTVDAVADTPSLAVEAAAGSEDSAIALDITSALTDTDGSETLAVTISGIPEGATLSAGTVNEDGSVTLTPAQLEGLTITPAANSADDFTLTVTATSTDGTDTATQTAELPVTVTGVADEATLGTATASGDEDSAIALDIDVSGVNAGDSASVTISGIPEGATLSAGTVNEDGSVTLTPAQLEGLTITPAANSDADFTLTVAVTTTDADSGDTATVTETLDVTVDAVADTPSLAVDAAAGSEDSAIALDITSALTDTDGSETLAVTISGIPEGATLSAGTVNEDGSVTLTPAQLEGLTITPAANSADDFTLTVTATSTDGTDTATQTASLPVSVTGVADEATLGTASASGDEDSAIALDIDVSGVNAGDSASVTISGIPEGATLSAGTVNEDGSVTLTPAQLEGLTITPAADSDADFTLTVAVTTTDADSGDTATVTETLDVTVDAVADTPSLAVDAAAGSEDSAIALDITSALTDTDGSETLAVTISGIPEGATLSAGTVNEDGSVTLTPAQLEGLTITPAANSADDFTLTVTATSTDGTDTATQTAELPVTVTGVADEATLGTAADSGDEDSAIALDINVSNVADGDSASVTISGIPDGATLSAGTVNEDGTVTLTPAQLEGLTITPAADSDADFTLTVAVTTTDADSGDTATVTETLDVTVDAVADTPSLAVDAAAGSEDSAIALDITSALTDTDGSETLAVTISGIPEGATLSAGTVNEDGSVTLTPAQLEGLTITPAANSADDFTLTVTATSTDGTDTATQTAELPVTVTGIADEATLGTAAASGDEDSAIALDIDVSNVADGDSASVTISGIPGGATLSAGTVNEDGSVTLTPAQLEGLTITPAADSDADFTLTVAVTTTDGDSGDTATVTETLDVTVDAVADTPSLAVEAAAGSEDSAIALDITSALTDTDGSETLAVTISGIPEGATLSAGTVNEDGSVTLTPAQLEGLTITPAANSADDFTLTVTATSTDGTDTATQTAELPVTVTGVADEATLGTATASGDEDSAIALDIDVSGVNAGDSASVTISGIPEGATLSAGTVNEDGSVTLTPAQLEGLTITPAANSDADFTLTVAVTTTDADSGDTATVTETLDVTVDAVADTPSLAVDAAAGSEDSAIALDITSALTDTDGSETLAVTISGIPEGATLSAGTVNEDGSVTLIPAQLEGLTITPAANSADDFTLTVTATSTDGTDTATQTAELPVTVTGVADEATLGTAAASGDEDSAIALDIDVSNVADGDSASVTISGIPGGATLSAGTVNEDGSVTLTPAQLEGLTITPAADSDADFTLTVAVTTTDADSGDTATVTETLDVTVDAVADTPSLSVDAAAGSEDSAIALDITSALTDTDGSETLAVTISGIPEGATLSAGTVNEDGSVTLTPAQLEGLTITPAANSADDFTLTVTATSTDGTDTATQTAELPVTVTGIADEATLGTAAASGDEDSAIALDIDVSNVADGDSASVTISGIPGGATLSAGTVNEDGSVTLTPAQLEGLTITPAADSDADFTLTVAVTTTDADSGDTATVTETLDVTVDAVADTPSLAVDAAAGSEDSAIALDITSALTDTDGSETLAVTISGIPEGATLSAGTVNEDGSVTLTPAQLEGLTITPAANSADDFTLTVTATSTDGTDTATQTASLPVSVTGVADEATLGTAAASGDEDSAIALDIDVSNVADGDSASVTISGIPGGATLSAGTVNEDGSVTLTPAQLEGLTITPAADSDADFTLTVAVTTTDADSGDTATVTETLDVTVDAVADTPSLAVEAAVGSEDSAIALDITSALTDTDGSETLAVTISGIPEGATLSAGTVNEDGSVTLTPAQLEGLTITPAANSADDFTLTVTATSTDGTDTATQTAELPVTVTGVADEATLGTATASGDEDSAIALDIDVSGVNAGDSASVTISGIPEGATLSAGTVNEDGSVTLTPAQLEGLTITPAADSDADFTLTVAVTTTDGDSGDTATVTETLDVTVDAVADTPSLAVEAAVGSEDSAIALDITSALTDTDGSETLAVTISGIPEGATLSAGTVNEDGSVTLTPAQLEGLTITPAANSADDFTLTVTATSTDGTDTATQTAELPVTVTGVADEATLGTAAASGDEDSAIALDINVSNVADGDSASVTISGIPDGATLSAGTVNEDGTVTLTPAQLEGLTITPAADSDADFTLTVAVTTTDADSGDTATVTETLDVTVDAVADTPSLAVDVAAGSEDSAIALDITSALTDTDGSETLAVTISGIPEGATLSAGTVNEDGSVTLTPAQLEGLTITPAANSAEDFTLTVTATSTDGTDTATQTASLPVSVTGVADEATLGTAAASGDEDSAIALDIDVSGINAGDSASVTISGIPEGATLSAGTVNEDGSVTLTPAQLEGLTITPASDSDADFTLTVAVTTTDADSGDTATVTETLDVTVDAVADTPSLAVEAAAGSEDSAIALDITSALTDTDGSETLAVTISGIPEGATLSAGTVNEDGSVTLIPAQLEGLTITPAANSADDFTLTVTATSTDGTDTATQTASLPVSVTGVADEATLGTAAASGDEDSAIALDIDVSGVNAGDSASVTISGIPEGATLSAGTVNEDGSVTLTPAQLEGLTITPASDSDADFTLTVAVTTTDVDSGDTATVTETLDVTVDAVADTPSLAVEAAAGSEDSAIALDITSALTDTDGSETLAVTISGIPEGATLSAGTVNEDGSVTLTPAQLEGLTITPAANSAEDFTLTVTATSTDGTDTATQTASLPVSVTGVADEATLGTASASGDEDSAIALDIDVSGVNAGDSASVTISGIPEGATLSAGTVNEDGSVTLTPAQLEGLTITPASDSDADFTLTVAVTTTDVDSGDTATVTETLDVTVDAVADTPSLAVEAAAGSEDSAIALDITSALTDTDGSETLAVTISGIPEGATLSAGTVNEDGSVTLTPAQLEGLTITPAANSAEDFTLTVTATSTDGTDTATQTASLPVSVTGVADEAGLATAAASGDEDSAIALDIDVSNVADGDSASVTISGIPEGATLSAGTVNEDGSVTLTPAQLEGLTITPASDSDADFTLTVAVTTTDGDSGDTATVTETLDVTVDAVADTPSLAVDAAAGAEDSVITLDITSALTDTDGSETLAVTISGIPEGATLSAGTVNEDGTVTLTPAQLEGLTITPAANSADDFTLTVTATSTDGTDTATQTAELPVTVTGVADEATLGTAAASGVEDSAIALDIDVSNVADGDSASVTISGIPEGATLSAGTVNDDGSVTLTPAQLEGLTITPAADSDADFTLTVAVTTTDGDSGDTATVTETLDVTVDAVADTPSLAVEAAAGSEDSAIALDITSALTDTDGSETLSVEIGGIPVGAILTANGETVTVSNGAAVLTANQLSDLTITPPPNSSDDFTLTVTATSTDGDDTATTVGTIPVTVDAVADAPELTTIAASGEEDSAIALDISAALTDDSETLTVEISNIPNGAVLTANGVAVAVSAGVAVLTASQLDALEITPPPNSSDDFTLTVTATSTDGEDTATTVGTIPVTVDAVADTPTLSAADAAGTEDAAIALNIQAGSTDSGEVLSIEIGGIPAGAILQSGDEIIQVTNGSATLTEDQLSGLTIKPPTNDDSDFDLSVTVTATDGNDTATQSGTLSVTVDTEADTPTLDLSAATASANSVTVPIALPSGLQDALVNTSEPYELPAGTGLQGEIYDTGSSLSDLSDADALIAAGGADVTFTSTTVDYDGGSTLGQFLGNDAASASGTTGASAETFVVKLTGYVFIEAGSHSFQVTSDDGFRLKVGGTTVTEFDGNRASATSDGTFVAETDGLYPVEIVYWENGGDQDLFVKMDGTTLGGNTLFSSVPEGLTLNDSGYYSVPDTVETVTTLTVSDLPEGAVLSAGTQNQDGTWTVAADDAANLTVTFPNGGVHAITATVTDSEGNAIAQDTLSTGEATSFTAALEIEAALIDLDGSETLSVTISNLPTGAVLSAGTVNGDGSVTLTPAQLDGLSVSLPNGTDTFDLSVTATSTDGTDTASITQTLTVTVPETAGTPTLSVSDASGNEDSAIDLDLSAAATDSGDVITVELSGVPTGAIIAVGGVSQPVTNGTVTLSADQLSGVTITPPPNSHADFDLTVTAKATDGQFEMTSSDTITVSVTAVADAPTVSVSVGSGSNVAVDGQLDPDTAYPLTISAQLLDSDGSESLSISLGNLPEGASLSADGTAIQVSDGSATLTADQLSNLVLTIPAGADDFDLSVTATATDANGATASTTQTALVDVPEVAGRTIDGGTGSDTLQGGAGDDVITGDNPAVGSDDAVNAIFHFELEDASWSSNETVTDSVNGVTGTAKGGTGSGSGTEGTDAAQFDGSGDYIEVPHSAAMELNSGTFSVDFLAWNNGTIASKDSSNYDDGGHFDLKVNSSREVELRVQTENESFYLKGGDINYSDFYNATVTWDGSTVTLYVNGTEVDSVQSDYSMAPNQNPWTFGASQTTSGDDVADNLHTYLDGRIDNPTLLDGALTSDQVATLASGGIADYVQNHAGRSETTLFETDFEDDPTDFVDTADGWSTTSDKIEVWGNTHTAADGSKFIELNTDPSDNYSDASNIYRDIQTEAGKVYSLTFQYSGRPGFDDTVNAMKVSVGGETLGEYTHDLSNASDHDWQEVTVQFVGDGTVKRIEFAENGTDVDYGRGMRLDAISLTSASSGDDDTIDGGAGDDTIYAGNGDDVISGGTGNDVIHLGGDSEGVVYNNIPVSHWKLDETSGSTVVDSRGDNDGTVEGGTVLDFSGRHGSAADFDGSNDYIQVAHDSSMELQSGSLSFNFKSDQQQNTLVSKGDNGDGAGQFQLTTRNDGKIRFQFTKENEDSVTVEGGSISWDSWNNVTVTWGEEGLQLYLNGSLVDSDTSVTNGIDTNSEPLRFGVRDDLGDDFDGAIDDIALYDQQLSATDISYLSNNGVDALVDHSTTIIAAGADTVDAGSGDDTVIGGEGADTIDGGSGIDTIDYSESDEAVTIDFGSGTVSGGHAEGDDISNFENMVGSAHNDTLIGDSGANRLDGGAGSDDLTGGAGADVFVLGNPGEGIDTITDFNAAEGDMLDISSVVNMDDIDQLQNYLKLEEDDAGNTTVKVNANGDGNSDNFEAVATLEGVTGLDVNDIIQNQDDGSGNV